MNDAILLSRSWTIESELGQEKKVIQQLVQSLKDSRFHESRLDEIVTSVAEACLNAIEHGNGLNRPLPVTVSMRVMPDRYMFRICDRGGGFRIGLASEPAPQVTDRIKQDNPRGWGLVLIKAYSDSVSVFPEDGGSCVELQFIREQGGSQGE